MSKVESNDPNYSALLEHVRETGYLVSTAALLEWDQQTKMPALASDYRCEQITHLAGLIHQRKTLLQKHLHKHLGFAEPRFDEVNCEPSF